MKKLSLKSDILFRTYSESNEKSPIHKYRKGQIISSFEECQKYKSYSGILNEDYVLIDIDETPENKPMGDLLNQILQEKNYHCKINESDRGWHFFFRNSERRIKSNKTGIYLACGIKADIKAGCTNGVVCLRKDGKDRTSVYDESINGTYDEIPCWLLPVDKVDIGLWKMKEGDGRDSTLYSYILKLLHYGFSKDEIKKIFYFVNEYIFTDKLSDGDIDRITRDEAFPEELFFNGKKFLHAIMAKMLISELSIKLSGGKLYSYNGQYFESGDDNIKRKCTAYFDAINRYQKIEVICSIRDRLTPCELVPSDEYVCFKNGIINIETWELEDFNSNIVLFNQVPHNYNPNAYDETLDRAMDDWFCGDKKLRAIAEEYIGYILIANTNTQKMLFIEGSQNNGKSTFIKIVQKLIGDNNYSSLDIDQLGERFSGVAIENKMANICDDIENGSIYGKSLSLFKRITSGDSFKGENKGKDIRTIKPYAKLLFSFNECPSMSDTTGAVERRIIFLPFNNDFSAKGGKRDPEIISKLTTENAYEYLIVIAVNGLKRLISNNYEFTYSDVSEKRKIELFTHADTIKEFCDEYITDEYVKNLTVGEVRANYKKFCKENGCRPASDRNFEAHLNSIGFVNRPRKDKNGKGVRKYVRK